MCQLDLYYVACTARRVCRDRNSAMWLAGGVLCRLSMDDACFWLASAEAVLGIGLRSLSMVEGNGRGCGVVKSA
jgi:hypothetical protein